MMFKIGQLVGYKFKVFIDEFKGIGRIISLDEINDEINIIDINSKEEWILNESDVTMVRVK